MEISIGEYTFIKLESEKSLNDAKKFVSLRNTKKALCNFGNEIEFNTSLYSISNHFKVDKSIKVKELSLENRLEFMKFINLANKYVKYDINDCMNEIGKSGVFINEKRIVGAYIIKDNVIENIYSEIKLDEYLKKLVNKFEICKIKCDSTDKKLKSLIESIGFVEEKVINTYYKL